MIIKGIILYNSYIFPLVLIVKTNFKKFYELKIPFDHHFIKKDGQIRPVIKVKFEDFLKNVHQTIDIGFWFFLKRWS